MGLFDSVKDAVSSVGKTAGDAVRHTTNAGKQLVDAVERAPATLSSGARAAIDGTTELARTATRNPRAALRSAARHAVDGAKAVGTWAWKHKADIGFWAGTTALMLAVPVSGGASGALAGGLMAARGAAIAARVARAGRIGAAAVRTARTGAAAVRTARGAMGAMKVGAALARGNEAIAAGRVALGGTTAGRAMIAARRPVNTALNAIVAANFADTGVRYARGDASGKDMALATLALAPVAASGGKFVAARRSTSAGRSAAKVASRKLDAVAAQAASAQRRADAVVAAAPRVRAPHAAHAAGAVRHDAAEVFERAVRTRAHAARSTQVDARALADDVRDVAVHARTASRRAATAEAAAPAELTPALRSARQRARAAERTAARAERRVAGLAQSQQRAERAVRRADAAKEQLGTAGTHAFNLNNAVEAAADHDALNRTDGSLARGIANWLLGRNARMVAATPAGAR